MATGTAGGCGRQFHTQQVHYLRASRLRTTDNGIGTVTIGTIPGADPDAVTYVSVGVQRSDDQRPGHRRHERSSYNNIIGPVMSPKARLAAIAPILTAGV